MGSTLDFVSAGDGLDHSRYHVLGERHEVVVVGVRPDQESRG